MKHKDHYNDDYILDIARRISLVMPDFDEETFSHDLIGQLVNMLNGMEMRIGDYLYLF